VQLGHTAERWQRHVLAVDSGYCRAIGAADLLIEKAREIAQVWLPGINCARQFEAARFKPAQLESVAVCLGNR